MSLTKIEQETIILFNEGEADAEVYTHNVKLKNKLTKMAKKRVTGYQIQLATDSKFTKNKKEVTVKGYSKASKKVSKLQGGKKYYVRIRTYMTVNGEKCYSPWSKVKTVTTKK